MKKIKKITGAITKVTDLSLTARDITITLPEPIDFNAGCFMNFFIEKDGEILRRAFSVSSGEANQSDITFTVRLTPGGAVTPMFWKEDIIGTKVELMGPLGLNTADKMLSKKIFLFGFGVGAGVVKSLAEHFAGRPNIESIVIMTGNRSEEDLLHKNYFDELARQNENVSVNYILPKEDPAPGYKKGYIQDHLADLDFNHSDVYVCGREIACNALVETVRSHQPEDCHFFIEAFH